MESAGSDFCGNCQGISFPVGGLPWVRAAVVGYAAGHGGNALDKFLSPTGWNGGYHQSTFVAGGWANKPGLPEAVPEGPKGSLIPKPDARYPAGKLSLAKTEDPDPDKFPGIIPMSWPGTSAQIILAGKGGGGWGAAGGIGTGLIETGSDRLDASLSLATGGRGGWAVRKPGGMPCEINGGIVYGHSTPGISLNRVNR